MRRIELCSPLPASSPARVALSVRVAFFLESQPTALGITPRTSEVYHSIIFLDAFLITTPPDAASLLHRAMGAPAVAVFGAAQTVLEFIDHRISQAHELKLRFGSLNHAQGDDIKSQTAHLLLKGKRTSRGHDPNNAIDPMQKFNVGIPARFAPMPVL